MGKEKKVKGYKRLRCKNPDPFHILEAGKYYHVKVENDAYKIKFDEFVMVLRFDYCKELFEMED